MCCICVFVVILAVTVVNCVVGSDVDVARVAGVVTTVVVAVAIV